MRAELNGRVRLSDTLRIPWLARPFITPIMAAPRFDRPMYQALDDYDRDWLVPGLGSLKEPELRHAAGDERPSSPRPSSSACRDEMGRELLWRGYPTDSRGTYFHRFWNRDQPTSCTHPIHRFPPTPLGTPRRHRRVGGRVRRAVVVVRARSCAATPT